MDYGKLLKRLTKSIFGRRRGGVVVVDGVLCDTDCAPCGAGDVGADADAVATHHVEPARAHDAGMDCISSGGAGEQDERSVGHGRPPAIALYWEHLRAAGRSRRTIAEYGYDIAWWERVAAQCRRRSVYMLRVADIEASVARMDPHTRARRLAALRSLARWYAREGYPRLRAEMDRLLPVRLPRAVPRDLGEAEYRRLRGLAQEWVAAGRREGVWVGLMLCCGLRVSEIATATWHGAAVRVRGKGGHERLVPAPDWVLAAMRSIPRDGRGGWAAERRVVAAVLARAGIRRLHTLRHTYASQLARHGVQIDQIREVLGHASITTTTRYARVVLPDIVGLLER